MLCVSGLRECDGCGECGMNREIHTCSSCGEGLYEGNDAYYINGEYYCETCIDNSRMVIEREE